MLSSRLFPNYINPIWGWEIRMGFFSKIAGLFSRSSREENLLLEGVEHAKAKRPEKALEIYNSLLATPTLSATVRASALYNRAMAYSALDDDEKAVADLQKALALPGLPENVQSAARTRLARLKKRAE
jgi:tetratricopeptide (TPR) repeat protein